ncbi:MAG TPA: CRISPR system precrRNA processing endoribonuclease RAMP protein Cas6 [Ktedonobacteraceae bacterium]|jgi:CRISPR-associated endoribonuclease Cas6|nr:CRISPR system precrRNA processing endoribonuclease RAMP protein Cas6 [Ktedonobacteraceae bacterium]
MNIISSSPSKLYALLLKLRPLEKGTLMPFSGELVHAAWLDWMRNAAPDVATMLHEGNKRRFFTCSSVQFPLAPDKMRFAERENVHLPVDPQKTYTIRITLLLGELFPLFYNSLLHFNMAELGTKNLPFMQIGKQQFLLEEVISGNDESSGWTGFTTFAGLVEKARTARLGNPESLTLQFDSLTTFNRSTARETGYGKHFACLPLPQYVFWGLIRRWQELAPPHLADIVQKEEIEHYINEEGIIIKDYELKTHLVHLVNHPQEGFVGSCKYHLRGSDDALTAEGALPVRRQLLLLAQLAFYTGVGYKTTMGMGRIRLV